MTGMLALYAILGPVLPVDLRAGDTRDDRAMAGRARHAMRAGQSPAAGSLVAVAAVLRG